jgi:hypothetical protein
MYAGAQDVVASRARHVRRRSLTTTKSGAYSPARGGTGMGGGTYDTPTIVRVGGAAGLKCEPNAAHGTLPWRQRPTLGGGAPSPCRRSSIRPHGVRTLQHSV